MRLLFTLAWLCGIAVLQAWFTGCEAEEPEALPALSYTVVITPDGVVTMPAGPPGVACTFSGTTGYAQLNGTVWFVVTGTYPRDFWDVLTCDGQEPVRVHVIEQPRGA